MVQVTCRPTAQRKDVGTVGRLSVAGGGGWLVHSEPLGSVPGGLALTRPAAYAARPRRENLGSLQRKMLSTQRAGSTASRWYRDAAPATF